MSFLEHVIYYDVKNGLIFELITNILFLFKDELETLKISSVTSYIINSLSVKIMQCYINVFPTFLHALIYFGNSASLFLLKLNDTHVNATVTKYRRFSTFSILPNDGRKYTKNNMKTLLNSFKSSLVSCICH